MGGVALGRVVPRDGVTLPHHALLLLASIAAAVVAQGGYYLPGRVLAVVLVGIALLITPRPAGGGRRTVGLVAPAGGALAGWAVARASTNGAITDAVPTVAAVGCLVAAAVVAGRLDVRQRELCASVVVGVGVLVALTGWAAVVWRIPSWSVVADGLARAASTLTYPNATAALLAALAVLATSLHVTRPRSAALAGAVFVLLVGVGATLSRAGLLALLVGLAALALSTGVRRTLRHAGPAGVGALVALGGLAPSFPVAEPGRPAVALLGLVAGAAVTSGLTRARPKLRVAGVTAAFGVLVVGAFVIFRERLFALLETRITFSSPDRAGATRAAMEHVAERPWSGTGPGRAWFVFTRPTGEARVMRYVHNEYLQALVELGAIGLALVALLIAAMAVTAWRGRSHGPWAGAAAALVVLLVHSGFDFLWHLPVVVLTAGLLVGLAGPEPAADTPVDAAVETKEKL